MDLTLTLEAETFRKEVKAFLDENLGVIAEKKPIGNNIARADLTEWHKKLHERGWIAPSWPKEHGGAEWNVMQKHVWDEESSAANAPRLSPFGLSMVGPVIYTYGNDEQKAKHLPGILNGDTWWCQGYSEPGSGSDLASLRTKADRDGDNYIVNGHKIWTSNAHMADWIFCLVRTKTEGKQQEGISFLLIDIKTPGIDIKPIVSIDELHHLNEVFFTDVKVPIENRIGEENMGWTYAKFLLVHERTNIGGIPDSKKRVERLKEIASVEADGAGGRLVDDPAFKNRLSEIESKLASLEYTNLRILSDMAAGKGAGPASSLLKVVGTEVQQALTEMTMEALAHYAAPSQKDQITGATNEPIVGPDYAIDITSSYNFLRAATIYGGSNEVQRNVMAKAVLGL